MRGVVPTLGGLSFEFSPYPLPPRQEVFVFYPSLFRFTAVGEQVAWAFSSPDPPACSPPHCTLLPLVRSCLRFPLRRLLQRVYASLCIIRARECVYMCMCVCSFLFLKGWKDRDVTGHHFGSNGCLRGKSAMNYADGMWIYFYL